MKISAESVRMALFIAEYPKDLNATQAAKRAGYKWPDKLGPRLLQHPAVAAAIGLLVQERLENAKLTVDRTLEEVRRIAFFDPINVFENNGTVRQIIDIPPEARACIASIEVVELFEGAGDAKRCFGLLKKIKFHDKNASLDKSMRYHSLYRDKIEHAARVTLEDLICEARGSGERL